jgi:HAD superfamily hydrolase (TIGR01662 family)
MGADGPDVRGIALEITRGWENSENFELYDDVLPTLAALRGHGLKLGLVSNTSRDLGAFVGHFGLDVDAWIASGAHGKVKPSPSIFRVVLEQLGVPPERAAMVGDSPDDDVAGARDLGMRAFLLDREGRFPPGDGVLPDLRALPAALGLRVD